MTTINAAKFKATCLAVLDRVENLIDPEKVSVDGVDDADPHVIALGVHIKSEGDDVTILTEDFNSSVTIIRQAWPTRPASSESPA